MGDSDGNGGGSMGDSDGNGGGSWAPWAIAT